jgi:hypothetical protein
MFKPIPAEVVVAALPAVLVPLNNISTQLYRALHASEDGVTRANCEMLAMLYIVHTAVNEFVEAADMWRLLENGATIEDAIAGALMGGDPEAANAAVASLIPKVVAK